jgi:hypothetical protein
VYGALAVPVGIVCQSETPNPPAHIQTGFCFMTPACDVNSHITCHRYKQDSNNPDVLQPVRTSNQKGHYSKYSSSFNGKYTDSNM